MSETLPTELELPRLRREVAEVTGQWINAGKVAAELRGVVAAQAEQLSNVKLTVAHLQHELDRSEDRCKILRGEVLAREAEIRELKAATEVARP